MKPVETVLLVEDNADDEELTRLAFEENAIAAELVVVRDGSEALEYLFGSGRHAGGDRSPLPSLVLLDIKLPKLGGHEVLERIRADERTKRIPVVMMTTSGEARDRQDSTRLGADGFLRKSVDFPSFSEALGRIAHVWLPAAPH
ncbi:response regulator rcp1 [mine drainage metagenome]|uniref:Response regulator rcp1 n=1 Tax=mine drainage metagenome TaxID=410659 RepID=A0A1J5RJT5_9ZZZZ